MCACVCVWFVWVVCGGVWACLYSYNRTEQLPRCFNSSLSPFPLTKLTPGLMSPTMFKVVRFDTRGVVRRAWRLGGVSSPMRAWRR